MSRNCTCGSSTSGTCQAQPAVGVGVEVELVHDDLPDVGERAGAQRDVGQDLRGAADDGCAGVHRRVAGHHPDPLGAERLDEGEELLAHQRLQRGGVEGAGPGGQRRGVRPGRHQRLARPGGGGEHDVGAGDDLDERLLLRGVQLDAARGHPRRERLVDAVGVVGARGRQQVGELGGRGGGGGGGSHGPPIVAPPAPAGTPRGDRRGHPAVRDLWCAGGPVRHPVLDTASPGGGHDRRRPTVPRAPRPAPGRAGARRPGRAVGRRPAAGARPAHHRARGRPRPGRRPRPARRAAGAGRRGPVPAAGAAAVHQPRGGVGAGGAARRGARARRPRRGDAGRGDGAVAGGGRGACRRHPRGPSRCTRSRGSSTSTSG